MSWRIREAVEADAEALHVLYHRAYANDPHRSPGRALGDTLEDVRASIREGTVLVAEDEAGRLVATVMVRRVADVRRLAVDPDRKGEGLGAQLLEAAVDRATREGFAFAQLGTLPEHPWLPDFYRRHGFADRAVEEMVDGGGRWLLLRRRLKW